MKNKGITLVALVVTIIILLILAGISIATLTGSGLFENARLAEQKSKNAQELEDSNLKDYENKIGEYVEASRNIKPTGTINITENGEYDVTNYAKVNVNVDFSNYKITSLIPEMTSNNTPSGLVEASSYAIERDPYHAFEGSIPNANLGTGYWFSMYKNSWLTYTWENEVNIGLIEFCQEKETEFKVQYLENGDWKDLYFSSLKDSSESDIFKQIKVELTNIIKTKAIRFYNTYVISETMNTGCAIGNVRVYGLQKNT